ncbi:hypothetical protein FRC15_010395 [Serendipita sp. 397]|nr:hypothetical protein FRC15_010395 [Serendipita sp. 397]
MPVTTKTDNWNFSFTFGEDEESEEDVQAPTRSPTTVPQTEPQPGKRVVEPVLSEEARLARDLDISTRKEAVTFQKTPWTIARQNAALRPPLKPSYTPQVVPPRDKKPVSTVFDGRARAKPRVASSKSQKKPFHFRLAEDSTNPSLGDEIGVYESPKCIPPSPVIAGNGKATTRVSPEERAHVAASFSYLSHSLNSSDANEEILGKK